MPATVNVPTQRSDHPEPQLRLPDHPVDLLPPPPGTTWSKASLQHAVMKALKSFFVGCASSRSSLHLKR
jgi:hypothetical protein